MLTNIEILALRPREKSYKVADGLGLYIQVQPTGSILWRFKYRFSGIERKLCFGSFPEVSLKEARALRDEARGKVAAGIDPSAVRRKAKLEAAMAASDTFRAIADEFIAKMKREGKSEATIKKANWFRDLLDRDIGHRPISEITPQELLHSIRRVEKRGHHETALRLRSFAGRVFRYAMATVRTDRNPSEVLRGAFTIPKVKHRSAIVEPHLVAELMRSISCYSGRAETRIALQMAAHTFVRPGELRYADWSEFDMAARVWRIPGERMKMGLPHDVPLSDQVIALVESLKAIGNRGQFCNWAQLFEQPLRLLDCCLAPPLLSDHRDIFLGKIAEAVRSLELSDELVTLPLRERIGALMDFQLGLVTLAPGFGEADIRIGAKRNALLLSMHRVFEAPQARAGRMHLDVEAVGIGDFVDAIPRLEGPDLNIAKRHGSTPLKGLGPAPITALEANGPSSKTHSKKDGPLWLF